MYNLRLQVRKGNTLCKRQKIYSLDITFTCTLLKRQKYGTGIDPYLFTH
jgi:hypothetical protein